MKRIYLAGGPVALALLLALALAACAETDVVARIAKSSFAALVDASGPKAAWDADSEAWALSSAGGERVLLAADFAGPAGAGLRADVTLDLDAAPFLAAGLDPARLVGGPSYGYAIEGQRLRLRFELADAKFAPEARTSFKAAFAELVRARREVLGYHAALDHYGLALGGGNMFEWAKDASKNDKDLVWVLDPAALVVAGLDPSKVEGWIFAEVEVMDESGAKKLVEKLLKPYDLF